MTYGAVISALPLLAWVDQHHPFPEWWERDHASLARVMRAARQTNRISFVNADRLCCLAGVHMAEIYDDEYWTAHP